MQSQEPPAAMPADAPRCSDSKAPSPGIRIVGLASIGAEPGSAIVNASPPLLQSDTPLVAVDGILWRVIG